MCLLCEELWMPFELPPEAKARTFVADAPEPDSVTRPIDQVPRPRTPEASPHEGEPPAGA
jgi:hypothetical protein